MRQAWFLVGTAFSIAAALSLGGCASTNTEGYTPPTSIYGAMDSTSLVYTNPMAASPINDHPLRWIAFLLHPIGVGFDYGVNRPVYGLSSLNPNLHGYTSEDAMLDAQRYRLGTQ
ncbi:MAG: hypothetical protein KatS3mg082_1598 [Nitrospiraceae bacterium]|jgi:hypothetical protein|nr:MAG: hypothetical protein KatS3mg082_1598 [Nitrospiraceae bacterium]